MSSKRAEEYKINGVIDVNGRIYIPIDDVIGLCNHYASATGNTLSKVLFEAKRNIKAEIPKYVRDVPLTVAGLFKSLFKRKTNAQKTVQEK